VRFDRFGFIKKVVFRFSIVSLTLTCQTAPNQLQYQITAD